MERPGFAIPAGRTRVWMPARLASVGIVGALHVVLIYGLAIGLAARLAEQFPQELTAQVIKPEQPKKEPPPPVDIDRVKPTLPTVPVPLIKIQQHTATQTITAIAAPPPVVAPPVVFAPPTPQAPTPASAIARTHTAPPYPEQSRRLGEQGTVRLRIEVAVDGSVSEVEVVASSGSSTLDAAAATWVKNHWRYKPATQEGHAVSSSVLAAVVFNLKNAG